MQKLSAKQLALGWAGMTVGCALMLPGIRWLLPIGIVVCFGSGFIMRTEAQAAQQLWRLFFIAAIAITTVTIHVTSERGLTAPKDGPSPWYVSVLVITWVVCAASDYRRWKKNRGDEAPASESHS